MYICIYIFQVAMFLKTGVCVCVCVYIYIYIYKKQLMVASGQQRMPLRQEDQRFTVQASLHGIKTR